MDTAPARAVIRSGTWCRGIGVERVQAATHERVNFSFHSSWHLLAAYQDGVRGGGESCVEGLLRSTLRDVARKLTLVPAGHRYRGCYDQRMPTGVTYFYFNPAELQIDSDLGLSEVRLAPRLFFEDETLWNTLAKLGQAVDAPGGANKLYIEALGAVLIHELVRLNNGTPYQPAAAKGGLAAWQRQIVTTYIEEHLSEQIPVVTLARLARLSTFHFCRAFKQSFGIPPHRYHTHRRIERAKLMLAEPKYSATEIAVTVGFSGASSFAAAFRKMTGQTPGRYHRALG